MTQKNITVVTDLHISRQTFQQPLLKENGGVIKPAILTNINVY